MKELFFDVMVGEMFICTLKMPYNPLFPISSEEVKKFVISKRPTLRNRKFRIELIRLK